VSYQQIISCRLYVRWKELIHWLAEKLSNVNVNYLKIPKKRRGCTKCLRGLMFEIPVLKNGSTKHFKNGDRILRSWLLYSKLECGLYCFCFKLFRSGNDHSLFVAKSFKHFWHLNPRIYEHGNSQRRGEWMDKWEELTVRLPLNQTIDKENQNLMNDQRKSAELC